MTFPQDKDKKSTEFTKKDAIEVRRYAQWETNYEQFVSKNYLNADKFEDILYVQENVSPVETLFVRYSLEDFLKESGFAIEKECDIGHDGDYTASYSNIEYDYKQYRRAMSSGSYFLTRGVDKYILSINPYPEYTRFSFSNHRAAEKSGGEVLKDLLAFARKNNFLRGKKIDGDCKFVALDTKYTWDDLILDEEQKDSVRKNLFNLIEHSDIYQKNGIVIKRGLIFKGPPGTGKTLLAKILCNTVPWSLVWVTPGHLEESRDIRRIVSMCRDLAPSILFLEDIDLYGGARSSNNKTSLLGELMNQLDGLEENKNVITIATTNDVETLEQALLKRPGRFDKVIEFGEPNAASRQRMLELFARDLVMDSDVDFKKMSTSLDGFTGAQVRELVSMAVLCAVDTHSYGEDKKLIVKKAHFDMAQGTVKNKDYKQVGFAAGTKSSDSKHFSLEELMDGNCPDLDD